MSRDPLRLRTETDMSSALVEMPRCHIISSSSSRRRQRLRRRRGCFAMMAASALVLCRGLSRIGNISVPTAAAEVATSAAFVAAPLHTTPRRWTQSPHKATESKAKKSNLMRSVKRRSGRNDLAPIPGSEEEKEEKDKDDDEGEGDVVVRTVGTKNIDRRLGQSSFRTVSRITEREYRREEDLALETLVEALSRTRRAENPLGYLKSYVTKAKARMPGDTETKYSLLQPRSYANAEILSASRRFVVDHGGGGGGGGGRTTVVGSPPTLDDLNQKPIGLKESLWVQPPFRLLVFFGSYFLFPYITELFKIVETTNSEDFSLVAGQFGPGVGVLYGTIVALTLDILYERQSRVQENVTLEAGLLSQITQHLLALFDIDDDHDHDDKNRRRRDGKGDRADAVCRDDEEYILARNTCQLVADQVRTLVKRTRGAELLTIMKADPYSQLLSIIDDYHREKDTILTLQQQSVVASLRDDIPQIMEARAKRLSDEASALPPTHFLVLSLLTGLIMIGYVVSTLTIVDEQSGRPPQESQLVFAALTAIYVLFYNFCNDLNGPFRGVYQIRRSSAASYLLQIQWLISNQPFGPEIRFDDDDDDGYVEDIVSKSVATKMKDDGASGGDDDDDGLGRALPDAAKSALNGILGNVTMSVASGSASGLGAPERNDRNLEGGADLTRLNNGARADGYAVSPEESSKPDNAFHRVEEPEEISEAEFWGDATEQHRVEKEAVPVAGQDAPRSDDDDATNNTTKLLELTQRKSNGKTNVVLEEEMPRQATTLGTAVTRVADNESAGSGGYSVFDRYKYFLETSGFVKDSAAKKRGDMDSEPADTSVLEEKRRRIEEKYRLYYESKGKSHFADMNQTSSGSTKASVDHAAKTVEDRSKRIVDSQRLDDERECRNEKEKGVDAESAAVGKVEIKNTAEEGNAITSDKVGVKNSEEKVMDEAASPWVAEEEDRKDRVAAQTGSVIVSEASVDVEAESKRLEEEAAKEEQGKAKLGAEEEKARSESAAAKAEAEAQRKREKEEQAAAAAEAALRAEEAEKAAAEAEAEAEYIRRAEEEASLRPLKDMATGVEFAPKLGDLYLLGVGVRRKAIVNVYAVAAYSTYEARKRISQCLARSDENVRRTAAPMALRETLCSCDHPTAFVLSMVRKVGADAMANAIAESVMPRHSGSAADVEKLKSLIFDGVKATEGGAATKGTTFLFECDADGVSVSVDGKLRGKVRSDYLGRAFCDVFFDDKAVSPSLKDSCLQNCRGP